MSDPLGASLGTATASLTKPGNKADGLPINHTETMDDISLDDAQDAALAEPADHTPDSLEDRISALDRGTGVLPTPATSVKVHTGGSNTAGFGSNIPHIDSPARQLAEDTEGTKAGTQPTVAQLKDIPHGRHRRSASLEVETGSFSLPAATEDTDIASAEPIEGANTASTAGGISLPLDRGPPPTMSPGLESATTARSGQTAATDLSSQAGTVVLHSSDESSPEGEKVEDEEPYSIKAVMPSVNRFKTKEHLGGQTDPDVDFTEETLDDDSLEDGLEQIGEQADGTARKLHRDFDATAPRPSSAQNGGPIVRKLDIDSAAGDFPSEPAAQSVRKGGPAAHQRKIDNSRPGVTASPKGGAPPAHATFAPDANTVPSPLRPDIVPPEGPFSEEVRLERERVAKELADAENAANQAALENQRIGSSGQQAAAGGKGADETAAPFTEENLRSDAVAASGGATPTEQILPARPFSPPPGGAAAPGFNEQGRSGEQEADPPEYRGLIYHDGIDAMGRPVIVVNADAVPQGVSRKAACHWMLQRLEPIVVQGPYVLVMLNTGRSNRNNRLPAGWLAASYREMSYPFKKNVKHVILVRPSAMLNFMVALMRPFISKKAYPKLKKVDSLSAMAAATNNEVTLQHLGQRFAAAAGQYITESLQRSPQAPTYQMPSFSRNVELQSR